MNYIDILTVIIAAKQALGITSDRALAERLGVTHQTIHNWKTGRTTPDVARIDELRAIAVKPGDADPDETEGRALYRRRADALATAQLAMSRRTLVYKASDDDHEIPLHEKGQR